jgi:thiamine biosynthesis lipoprotein
LLDALVTAGYDRSFDRMSKDLDSTEPTATHWRPASAASEWQLDNHTLALPAHVHLDFGGVAKGWAAHQAMQRLKSYGPTLVDAGGDIAISGLQSDQQPWTVAIADPFHPEQDLEMLKLGRSGVATSGTDFRRWKQDGAWKHHLIDPRTGKPAQTDVISATVIAPTVIEAEVAAKVVLISGSQDGLAWLETHPNLAVMLVLENGKRRQSTNFDRYLWS